MLLQALSCSLNESTEFDSIPILEDGEGPRWRFRYNNFKNDPKPDILLLGSYQHPNTGNHLIGGINLHYLTKQQISLLASNLPRIMAGNNLYSRYNIGRQLLPDVFNNFYRTYNAGYIQGIQKDIMYPRYGLYKTASDWVRRKLSSIYKTKKQRELDAKPKYPDDLSIMDKELDQAVEKLQKVQPADPAFQTPEVQAANQAKNIAAMQATPKQIEKQEDEPLIRAKREAERLRNPQLKPTTPLDRIGPAIDTDQSETAIRQQVQQEIPEPERRAQARQQFTDEQIENAQELQELDAEEEPEELAPKETPTQQPPTIKTADDEELSESMITYYSPSLKQYIMESINLEKI